MMKRVLFFAVAVLMLLNTACIFGMAEEAHPWLFIDGENISRGVNMAVIYRDVDSTGQDIWGCNVVIDAEGRVTEIIKAGENGSENTPVPEGGAVVAASGTKVAWIERYVRVGTSVYYDGYTQRLFVVDDNVGFDPFDVETVFDVTGGDGAYIITNPDEGGNQQYTYNVAVNAEGVVVSRGADASLPEGGFILSAITRTDMASLVMYAPVGAECTVSDGKATLKYDAQMLSRTVTVALDNTKAALESAKTNHLDVNYSDIEAIIAECEAQTPDSYEKTIEVLLKLEKASELCIDTEISELRAAFHTPTETSETLVRATVLNAKAAGLNTLVLRVTNGYGTFINLPEDFRFAQDAKFGGLDLLKIYSEVCEAENIALGLCVDVYYNELASVAAPEWLTVTNGGDVGLTMKYFSPASQEFKSYFLQYVDHIISNYDFDFLMFDYLRFPKFSETTDLGYDTATLQGFSDVSGIPIAEILEIKTQLFDSPHWQKWVDYRISLVDDMARSLSFSVRSKRPDLTVLATAERDSVDFYYMQNTAAWITDKLFDGICQIMFESDPDENDALPELGYYDGIVSEKGDTLSAYTGKTSYYFVGVESSCKASYGADMLSSAVEDSRLLGADGFVFADLNDFLAQSYASSLANGILRGNPVSPFADTAEAMKEILKYSEQKIKYSVFTAGLCEEETYNAAASRINDALSALEEGILTHEQASSLEGDIAALFASCEAKAAIVKDYETLTKLALLAKEEKEQAPPEDESTDASEDESLPALNTSVAPEDESASDTPAQIDQDSKWNLNIDVGTLLIYGFVGFTAVAAVAAIIVSIRRKKNRPAHSHMPRASRVKTEEVDEEIKLD